MFEPVWIWAILGLVLLGVEMLTGTFYVLWFGISALLVSLLLWLFPALSLAWQLLLFSVLSLGSLAIWRTYYKQHSADLRIGQSQGDEIGRVGTIIEEVGPQKNGRIQFTQGLMGSREWAAVADETISPGSQATVVAVEGNSLRVKTG
jgi:membrane protein implicated in regulation of membrane protease activity